MRVVGRLVIPTARLGGAGPCGQRCIPPWEVGATRFRRASLLKRTSTLTCNSVRGSRGQDAMHLPHDEENEDRSHHKQDYRLECQNWLFVAYNCSFTRRVRGGVTPNSTPPARGLWLWPSAPS